MRTTNLITYIENWTVFLSLSSRSFFFLSHSLINASPQREENSFDKNKHILVSSEIYN